MYLYVYSQHVCVRVCVTAAAIIVSKLPGYVTSILSSSSEMPGGGREPPRDVALLCVLCLFCLVCVCCVFVVCVFENVYTCVVVHSYKCI